MTLTFQPRTEDELNKTILLPEGEYDFDIIGAEEAVSKSNNPMIKLTLRVYAQDGNTTQVYDYLLAALEYKLKHFCDATGLIAEYESGNLSADMCLNRSGRAMFKIDKDKTGKYDDKNVVKDYVPGQHPTSGDHPYMKEDIPF